MKYRGRSVAVALALATIMALAATPAWATQKLTGPDAKSYVKVVLKDVLGNSYRHGYSKKLSCKRLSRVRMRCKVSWAIGDLSYKGHVTISYRRRDTKHFYELHRIKRINGYCIATGGRKTQCTKVYK